jgi:hypothetical protein
MSSDTKDPSNNGTVLNITFIKSMMSSTPKAELGALYVNAHNESYKDNSWKKWATHNHPHQCKLITALPLESSQATFSQGKPNQWTCGFTGGDAMKPRASSVSSGGPVQQILPTTGPNITVPPIISSSSQNFSRHKA